ncbi:MAG: hypothetical protein QOC97_1717 [Chloroflexota bacterium]|nr:hypothetical protein [Chloroflexota bacterium]
MPMIRSGGRAAAALISIALILAACSGGTTASGAPSSTGTPLPTANVPASAGSEATPASSGGLAIPSFDLSALTQGLSGLDSYQVSISVAGAETYKGTVVTKPVLSRDLTVAGGTRIVVIGNEAWMAQPGGQLTSVPGTMATGLFAAYDPTLLVGAFSGAVWAQNSASIGVEQKNGTSAHHYHIDATTLVGGFTGLPAGAVVDTWIADAGYLVAFEATGITGGDIKIEVTNVNDPANKVDRPS